MKVTNVLENEYKEILIIESVEDYGKVAVQMFNADGTLVGQIAVQGNSLIKAITNAMNN